MATKTFTRGSNELIIGPDNLLVKRMRRDDVGTPVTTVMVE